MQTGYTSVTTLNTFVESINKTLSWQVTIPDPKVNPLNGRKMTLIPSDGILYSIAIDT